MTTTRDFPLADILTITTGRLLSRKHMAGVYNILGWLTGDDELMTHQLSRAVEACLPGLLRQHPSLADVAPPEDVDEAELLAWLDEAERVHGATLPVAPVGGWEQRNPIEELCDMIGAERVIVVPRELP